MPVEFDKTVEDATFYSPMADFERDTQPVEYRRDPLTGQQSRVVVEWFPDPPEDPAVDEFVGDGEGCFFCPENVTDATPEYPDFVGMDRGSVGEATSFPNLFPYAEHSNVVVLTEDHFRAASDLTADLLADGLACALEYVAAVVDTHDSTHASVNMNLLPSAGSSVAHPHMQALVDDHGTNEARRRREAAREYHEAEGSVYWVDLLDAERDGERYVGATGDVEWIAPFAPTSQWHVRGITTETGVPDPHGSLVENLAAGLERVLQFYTDRGINAFNVALTLVPDDPACPAVFDVVARPPFDEYYVNDDFYFQKLHDGRVVDEAPEAYAPEISSFF